jgi:hypothetical protein
MGGMGGGMARTLKLLRAVQLAMLGGIVLYALAGEVAGPHVRAVDPVLTYFFTTLAVAIVGTVFVLRRTLVLRSAESLAAHPDDSLSLKHWKTGHIATYALCEGLALLGLVLRFLGYNFQQSLPYYGGAFLLLLFFAPKAPAGSGKE